MTELRHEAYEIPAAGLGPPNPLPRFRDLNEDRTVRIAPGVPEEDRRYLGWRTGFRVLPHRMQDGYDRAKKPRAFDALVLENDILRATFLPELGGRLVSLLHKPEGRELLDRNPVFQPANLALRNAWFSGGIEWNASHFGHHYLTCSPVYAAQVTGVQGEPVLRLYEWDRLKRFPWQIDFHLPPGSPFLYSHVRLLNPHDTEIPMYWWTNIAVPESPDARLLCPAETALHGTGAGVAVMDLPTLGGKDMTYATNLDTAQEFFFRIADAQRRWIAVLDGQGAGLVQTSTDRLRGRKMFCWGTSQGGRRWQEFLSRPGRAYLEIQAGLARTQMESVPMPAHACWTWTEAFGLLRVDPQEAHASDWRRARQATEAALEALLPREQMDAMDREFAATTTQPPDRLLAHGSGWGALERRRAAYQGAPDRIPEELVFPESSLGADQAPWLALLENGSLPEREPGQDPGEPMIQAEWHSMLAENVRAGRGDHWLSWLHLGIMQREALDLPATRQAWETSLARRRSGWALRNLATLEALEERWDMVCTLLREAWECGPQIGPLAVEYAQALLQTKQYGTLHEFVQGLPESIRRHERLSILSAKAALETGHLDDLGAFFGHEFASIREGEITLTDLWFDWHARRVAAAEGLVLDDSLRGRVRREFSPPPHIDFRVHADA